jgi:hypothetical protein
VFGFLVFCLVILVRAFFVFVVFIVDVHEVFNVLEQVLRVSAKLAGDEAREDATEDSNSESREKTSQLEASLLNERSSFVCLGEDDGSSGWVGP